MIKAIILIYVVLVSLYIAFMRVSLLRDRLKKNKTMLDFAERVRKNYRTQMLSPITLCNEVMGCNIVSSEQALLVLSEALSGAWGADEFCRHFSLLFEASEDELDGICNKLGETASNGYRLSSAEYEKVRNSVYILYPGLACIVSIIIM